MHELPRLREALGGAGRCPRILIKRDDLTGLAFGGNKVRKLEFLVGAALKERATVLVTSGAVQSNHARLTAAAARVAGVKASLVLTSRTECPPVQGNLLLDRMLGAEVHFIPANADPRLAIGDQEEAKIAEVVDDLKRRGERPYVIPVGGSSPIGVFGYATGTLELLNQAFQMGEAPTHLYVATGSRGTQGGLVLGKELFSAPYKIMGISVSGGAEEKKARGVQIVKEASNAIGVSSAVSTEDLMSDEEYVGPGYGIFTPECLEAVKLFAQTEGIFLDPVYTGKAAAGMIDHIRRGLIDAGETIVFLHTGGTPGLFARAEELQAAC